MKTDTETEAEMGVMQLHTESQGFPGTTWIWEKAWNRFSLSTPRRNQPCPHFNYWTSSIQNHESINFCYFKLQVCSNWLWQLYEAQIGEHGQ